MSRKQREKRSRAKSPTKVPSAPDRERSAPAAKQADASINKLGLIVAVVGLAGLFGLVLFLGEGPPPASTGATEFSEPKADTEPEPEEPPLETWQAGSLQEVPIDPGRDLFRGPEDARVSIVEFTDFQCPFCTVAHTSLKGILERLSVGRAAGVQELSTRHRV